MQNSKSKLLFTGPKARQMLDPNNGGERDKWKVFVLLDKNKQGLVLKKGSEILYQVNSAIMHGEYYTRNIMNV